jgi:hypothetical protein
MAMPPVRLLALSIAVSPNSLEQSAVADFARRIYAKSFARYPKLADVKANMRCRLLAHSDKSAPRQKWSLTE